MFDTLLDEQSILGLALGAGLAGLLPIPEIQYLAYLHNAEDQLRGEAATLSFFSNGQYRNPMVVRVAGLAYQRGFGGHFHNDNAVAVLRDIPGLVIACPARGDDAASMLRTCVAAAATDGTVSVFLEPIALYHQRDLHEPGDRAGCSPTKRRHVAIGRGSGARRRHRPDDRDVRQRRADESAGGRPSGRCGVSVRVLDLRWLAPLPGRGPAGCRAGDRAGARGRRDAGIGGVGEGVIAALVEARLHRPDAPGRQPGQLRTAGRGRPTCPALERDIIEAARAMLG